MSDASRRGGIVLGLVGPVCAGKSAVSRRLRELGAEIYEADAIVRSLYERPDVQEAVRALFGDGVLLPTGEINRPTIASRIFADAELRRRLTDEIIFPRTGELLQSQLVEFRGRAGATDVLVLDAPTLFEASRADWCDQILLVSAPLDRRREWATTRGWDPGELDRRDAAMLPEAGKRQRAHFVIENTGSLADLSKAVDEIWRKLAEN